MVYEGANKSIAKGRRLEPSNIFKTAPNAFAKEIIKQLNSETRNDHHDPGHIVPWFYTQILQPLKQKIIKTRLNGHKRVCSANNLKDLEPFCFFPLQSEPEVSIQVLGRPYHKNQVELLRNLAASLPAGMRLLVKEHPRSLGLRPFSYYKQLFQIPNLYLAEMHITSMSMVKQSEFVAIFSGTIGLEAIMVGKPVLILGHPKYEDVSGCMTQKCYDLFLLPDAQHSKNYKYERKKVVNYLCSLIESVAIDLYSSLLRKPGRHSFQGGTVSSDDNFQALARYVIKRISEVKNNMIEFGIGGARIGKPHKPHIIAEIAQAHDGSLGYAYSFVELAKEIGADAVKFQTHISKAESTWDAYLGQYFSSR